MKILILAHSLRGSGGISVAINIIKAIQKIAPSNEYIFIIPKMKIYEELNYNNHKVIFYEHKNYLYRILYDTFKLRKIYNNLKPNFVLSLGNFGLRKIQGKQGFLIHNPLLVYNCFKPKSFLHKIILKIIKIKIKLSLKYTDIVFCQTKTMKTRFINKFKFNKKITILPNVVSNFVTKNEFKIPLIIEKEKNKFKLFQLCQYYEHKNLELALKLFRHYKYELKNVVLFITISKEHGKKAEKLLFNIKKYKLENKIINLGPIPQKELYSYYKFSDALFFPTLLESFSATYPESMKYHLPIITSNLDFAKEVCEDAALYFDPNSITSVKETIIKLKNNKNLQKKLIEKGNERFKTFPKTWDEVVKIIINEINSITDENNPIKKL